MILFNEGEFHTNKKPENMKQCLEVKQSIITRNYPSIKKLLSGTVTERLGNEMYSLSMEDGAK